MFRLLIIGRPAAGWAGQLGAVAGDGVEFDTARLPSAGIRQFEATPPDVVLIADAQGGQRVETLVRALQGRPLGELTPLLLLCPLPDEAPVDERIETLDVTGWLPPDTAADDVLAEIESALDADLRTTGPDTTEADADGDAAAPVTPEQTDDGSASYFDGDVVLEPVEEPAVRRRVDRSTIFRNAAPEPSDGAIDAEALQRKLKAVRHEDYYVILEVRRGAGSQRVREAFHELYARFDPESLDFSLVRQFQDELDEIRDALEDAFAVLGDPDLREAYLQHTVKR